MSRIEFYVPPLRTWPRRYVRAYAAMFRAVWPHVWHYTGWYLSRRECARLIGPLD